MLIIPAIDLLNGQIVRLMQGDFNSVKYYDYSPLDAAKKIKEAGLEWLHVVDLNGSLRGEITAFDIISKIKSASGLKIQFGGGIRTLADTEKLFDAGVDKVIIGSLSIHNKKLFEQIVLEVGRSKIIASIDSQDNYLRTKGWSEQSVVTTEDHIRYCLGVGINTFLCTDIKKDGMLAGPAIGLYKKLRLGFPEAKIIASGGIGSAQDLIDLQKLNLYGVVVGKAIYEQKISLEELSKIGS